MSGPLPSAASLNIGLLNRLRAAGGGYVPAAELASVSGRVRDDLDALEAFGFGIERHPYLGAAYVSPADRLCPDQIEHELATIRVGRRIAVWDRVSSTNDLAAAASGSASNDGLVVLADEQTAGRGRLGRSWTAPPRSSILMSVLLFPPPELDVAGPDDGPGVAWLTAIGAVATAEVVSDRVGRPAAIKWPNDVRVDGRKIAGILVERPVPRGPSAAVGHAAVIGIGLNVNVDDDALPLDVRNRATSIRIERGGRPEERSEVARDLIRRLDHWYESARSTGSAPLDAAWRERSEHLGRIVRVETPTGPRSGRVLDLDLRLGLTLATGPDDRQGSIPFSDHPVTDRALVRLTPSEILAIEETPARPHVQGTSGS